MLTNHQCGGVSPSRELSHCECVCECVCWVSLSPATKCAPSPTLDLDSVITKLIKGMFAFQAEAVEKKVKWGHFVTGNLMMSPT